MSTTNNTLSRVARRVRRTGCAPDAANGSSIVRCIGMRVPWWDTCPCATACSEMLVTRDDTSCRLRFGRTRETSYLKPWTLFFGFPNDRVYGLFTSEVVQLQAAIAAAIEMQPRKFTAH